jgi:PAS domain S-box-containing protein
MLPSEGRAAHPSGATRDLLVVAAVTGLAFVLSSVLELREWLTEVTRPVEHYQMDELPLTFAVLALALAWFAWRRWRHAEQELGLRVKAQVALAEREARYRTLFSEDLAGNAIATPSGEILLCNPAMARILGLADVQQAVGRNLAEFYADRHLWPRHRSALERGEKVEVPVLDLVSKDGAAMKAIARILPPISPEHRDELHVYLADISELHLMQRELSDTLAENRLLSQKYLMLQEEERRNLARELHDELGQCLNAIKLDAVSVRDMAQGRHPEVAAAASSIIDLSGHVYDVVRGIMQRLRPAALDALGLHDAIGHLVGQWQRRHRAVDCRFEASGDLADLGEVVNITVYRLVQECLTNITKHAHASAVTVSMQRTGPHEIRVGVCDDGRGMDLNVKRSGLGLVGLRERVEALNGRLSLSSAPGQGLEIVALLPASPRQDDLPSTCRSAPRTDAHEPRTAGREMSGGRVG